MLRIHNEMNGRNTDYSRPALAREARWAVKHAQDSDGKCRGWYIRISEHAPAGARVVLVADYLTPAGESRSANIAI